jgi:hypothetical protein
MEKEKADKKAAAPKDEGAESSSAASAANDEDEEEFIQLDRKICHSKGGKWDEGASDCDPFMKSSQSKIAFGDFFLVY